MIITLNHLIFIEFVSEKYKKKGQLYSALNLFMMKQALFLHSKVFMMGIQIYSSLFIRDNYLCRSLKAFILRNAYNLHSNNTNLFLEIDSIISEYRNDLLN